MVDAEQRERLLRGLFDSYYADHPQRVIFDTNRAWTAQLPALMRLFPDAKLICCVRDVAWVIDCLERQFRANAFDHTRLFNTPAERATVYTRLEALAHPNRLVGFAWQALREACYSEDAERVLLLEYDLLAARPARSSRWSTSSSPCSPSTTISTRSNTTRRSSTRARHGRASSRPPEGEAAAAQDHPASRPVPAFLAAGLLARSEGQQAFRIVRQAGGEMQDETMPGPIPGNNRRSGAVTVA